MTLEGVLKTLKQNFLKPTMALALCVSNIYCGRTGFQEPDYVYPPTVCGEYAICWQETEDTGNLQKDSEGCLDLEILTLQTDAKVRFTIFDRHTFERNLENGEVCDTWGSLQTRGMKITHSLDHYVCGNITDEGKLDLIASVDIFDIIYGGPKETISLEIWGDKKPNYEPF